MQVECKYPVQCIYSEMLKVFLIKKIEVNLKVFHSYWNLCLHLGWKEEVILNRVIDARYVKLSCTFLLGEMSITICPILAHLTLASTAR